MDKGLYLYATSALVAVAALTIAPNDPQILPLSDEDQSKLTTAQSYAEVLNSLSDVRENVPVSFDSGVYQVVAEKRGLVERYQAEAFILGIDTKVSADEYSTIVSVVEKYKKASMVLSQREGNTAGTGTAFLISEELALTNAHNINALDGVVPEGLTFFLQDYDGNEYDAEVLGVDGKADVALLKLETPATGLPYYDISDWDLGFRSGEIVATIGNAGTLGVWTAAIGETVTALTFNSIRSGIATINIASGASGSPVFGIDGKLKGILYASSVDNPNEKANASGEVYLNSYLTLNDSTFYLTADEILERYKEWTR